MAAGKQQGGGLGGLIFAAIIASFVFAPAIAGLVVAAAVLWFIFASNAKFNTGNNPALMNSGQRGVVEVQRATRSQVRSRAGKGPWMHTWTVLLKAMPPGGQAYDVTVYRKLQERANGPMPKQRFAAWFDGTAPQRFHIDWNSYFGDAAPPPPVRQMDAPARPVPRSAPRPAAASAPAYSFPGIDSAPLPIAEADAGHGFDFRADGVDARARIEDFALLEDGSTELALTVTPRGRHAYRTIVTTYVPEERRNAVAKGASLRVRVDPTSPGRLMIVS